MRRALIILGFCAASIAAAPPTTKDGGELEVRIQDIDPSPTILTDAVQSAEPGPFFEIFARDSKVLIATNPPFMFEQPAFRNIHFSANWNKQPFWDALNEACEAMQLRPSDVLAEETFDRVRPHLFLERGPTHAFASTDGIIMTRVTKVTRSGSVSLRTRGGVRGPQNVVLQLQIWGEPRLARCVWAGAPTITAASDENGHDIPIPPARRQLDSKYEMVTTIRDVALRLPPDSGEVISRLEGAIPLHIAKRRAVVVLAQPFDRGHPVSTSVGPNQLTIERVTGDQRSGYDVRMKFVRGADETDEHWHEAAVLFGWPNGSTSTWGRKGGRAQDNRWDGGGGLTSASAHCIFAPRDVGNDAIELRVEIPLEMKEAAASFKFKDLPMP